ncbi:hypothetical protein BK011_06795 [Tenericutes bacterium MZ-XQ]|nr:hypothetical protein BK011_06795 [Tenericutes bacterium MZ-XQ]
MHISAQQRANHKHKKIDSFSGYVTFFKPKKKGGNFKLNREKMIAFLIGYGYKSEEVQILSDDKLKKIIEQLHKKLK